MIQPGNWTLRKTILVAAVGLIAAGTLATGSYYAWLVTPPALPQTVEEALAQMGTKRFERMPEYRRREFIEHARGLMEAIPAEDLRRMLQEARAEPSVRAAMGQVWRATMVQRATDLATATPAERTKLLDEAIEQMEQWRGSRRRPRDANQRSAEDREGRRGRMRERIKNRIEQGNPQTAALIGEYFRAIRQRRQERGLVTR